MLEAPFVLLCAGEDSGDVLGEDFVSAVLQSGLKARGAGGFRMVRAGLDPVIDFEELPVSGFGDVLPRYFRLRKLYGMMKATLRSPDCVAFIAIDYPGFNMGLASLAKRLGKPVLYVAPPQVWAWKRSRAKKLQGVSLAVLFEFEKDVYEKFGCKVNLLRHPFVESLQAKNALSPLQGNGFLLLPGSRKSQALRNLGFYLNIVKFGISQGAFFGERNPVKIIAARESLAAPFEKCLHRFFCGAVPGWISVQTAPTEAEDRMRIFSSAKVALASPGTATLELSLSGCPLVVVTVPDSLTFVMGKRFVHTDFFAMPNILLQRKAVPEFIVPERSCKADSRTVTWTAQIFTTLEKLEKSSAKRIAEALNEKLQGGKSASEFFSQFIQRDAD